MERHPLIAALKTARVQLGLSQAELGRRIHKTAATVAHFENAAGDRQMKTIEDVAAGLGLRLALVPTEEAS
jgi:transcriptional regulator with XRE-family HTH domain